MRISIDLNGFFEDMKLKNKGKFLLVNQILHGHKKFKVIKIAKLIFARFFSFSRVTSVLVKEKT